MFGPPNVAKHFGFQMHHQDSLFQDWSPQLNWVVPQTLSPCKKVPDTPDEQRQSNRFIDLFFWFRNVSSGNILQYVTWQIHHECEPRWWFQTFFLRLPLPGKMILFDCLTNIFSHGLVQTPTRNEWYGLVVAVQSWWTKWVNNWFEGNPRGLHDWLVFQCLGCFFTFFLGGLPSVQQKSYPNKHRTRRGWGRQGQKNFTFPEPETNITPEIGHSKRKLHLLTKSYVGFNEGMFYQSLSVPYAFRCWRGQWRFGSRDVVEVVGVFFWRIFWVMFLRIVPW